MQLFPCKLTIERRLNIRRGEAIAVDEENKPTVHLNENEIPIPPLFFF